MLGSVLGALPVVANVTVTATLSDWNYYFSCSTNEKTERLSDILPQLRQLTRSQGHDSKTKSQFQIQTLPLVLCFFAFYLLRFHCLGASFEGSLFE